MSRKLLGARKSEVLSGEPQSVDPPETAYPSDVRIRLGSGVWYFDQLPYRGGRKDVHVMKGFIPGENTPEDWVRQDQDLSMIPDLPLYGAIATALYELRGSPDAEQRGAVEIIEHRLRDELFEEPALVTSTFYRTNGGAIMHNFESGPEVSANLGTISNVPVSSLPPEQVGMLFGTSDVPRLKASLTWLYGTEPRVTCAPGHYLMLDSEGDQPRVIMSRGRVGKVRWAGYGEVR